MDDVNKSAIDLMEAFREVEDELPTSVYKSFSAPIEHLCGVVGNLQKGIEQRDLLKRLVRIVEDNPATVTVDKEFVEWMERQLKDNGLVARIDSDVVRYEEPDGFDVGMDEEREHDQPLAPPVNHAANIRLRGNNPRSAFIWGTVTDEIL